MQNHHPCLAVARALACALLLAAFAPSAAEAAQARKLIDFTATATGVSEAADSERLSFQRDVTAVTLEVETTADSIAAGALTACSVQLEQRFSTHATWKLIGQPIDCTQPTTDATGAATAQGGMIAAGAITSDLYRANITALSGPSPEIHVTVKVQVAQ